MRKFLKNPGASDFLISDMGQVLPPGDELEILQHELHAYLNSDDLIQAIRDGDILAGDGWTYYTDPAEGELYFRTRFDDDTYIVDGTSVIQITPAVVQDQTTEKKGTTLYMNLLGIMRELYNAPENPIHDPDFQQFIGAGGREQEEVARIANLENIHAKTGFHWIELHKGGYYKPFDLLVYYGWLNSFNSAVNVWNNESVAKDMARYNLIIFGDGVQDPSHGDYSNTEIIIPRIKALNPCALIFGYVSANQTQTNFETKVKQWGDLSIDGIFMDECGYDYGVDRSEFNDLVDFVHDSTSTIGLVMTNAWNTDHIIGTANDASYPNSTYNPGLVESHLTADDWIFLESFPINTTAYSGNDGYESRTEWAARGVKVIGHRDTYGINLVGAGIINNANSSGQDLFDFGFISACMFALDGYGTSDTGYGASSAAVEFWDRPDLKGAGRVWAPAPSVQNDIGDNQIYWRYTDFAKFMLDFSSAAQDSSITIFGQAAAAPPGSGPAVKTGTTSTNAQGDGSVTFNTAFSDANYSIAMTALDPADVAVCMYDNKTAGGFDIRTENDQANNEPNVTVDWTATEHYDP